MNQNVTPAAANFFDQAAGLLLALSDRWADESGYESLADYTIPLKKVAEPLGVTVTKMHSRPFAVFFTVGERKFVMAVKKNHVEYRRLA